MKTLLKAACVAFVLTALYAMIPFQASCAAIPREVFRLHILAASDAPSDQALKLRVRDRVLSATRELFAQAKTKEEAKSLAAAHLQELADLAAQELHEHGCTERVRAELTRMPFTTRRYEDYTLPAGEYDALRLTIGAGEGHNWWCVMFPSLCIDSGGEGDRRAKEALGEDGYQTVHGEQREYRFYIVELLEKIRQVLQGKE